ncbi:hypothetical protein EJC51_40525 [Streptomyces aquilus]|uniref:DUF6777 domain-containing protein n=1 Tax=Streptomyces aquilus TaxID=2548456 RepID=A0A3S9IBU8_9ACTN|nr:DUF6777 domain-containing protein [Streptomyces aquilus]AZP21822.1 hypothetical protein EJC51_40525 [Streptomyces aquilus]
MRTFTGTFVTSCALSAALIVAGCAGGNDTQASGELFLQPVAAQGPDPFTASTATATATPTSVTRTQQPQQAQQPQRSGVRAVSGATPGLYGGTARTGSCDVNRQIAHLAADPAKGRAFAQVAGVAQASIPTYLRSLTSVVLRADTRVTNHGYRAGQATSFPAVLQTGTAVLVDNRGVPRVRCACGNPLTPSAVRSSNPGTKGQSWSGYRPDRVIVVTPAPQAATHITILDVVDHTWIERRCGHDVRHDHVVPRPEPVTPTPPPTTSASTTGPSVSLTPDRSEDHASPSDEQRLTPDCVTATVTVTPGTPATAPPGPQDPATATPGTPVTAPPGPQDPASACPAATVTAPPPTTAPETQTVPGVPSAAQPTDTGQDIGPETVPDTPDLPDGGGLIPDSPDEPTGADEPAATDSIFDSPTDVFGD